MERLDTPPLVNTSEADTQRYSVVSTYTQELQTQNNRPISPVEDGLFTPTPSEISQRTLEEAHQRAMVDEVDVPLPAEILSPDHLQPAQAQPDPQATPPPRERPYEFRPVKTTNAKLIKGAGRYAVTPRTPRKRCSNATEDGASPPKRRRLEREYDHLPSVEGVLPGPRLPQMIPVSPGSSVYRSPIHIATDPRLSSAGIPRRSPTPLLDEPVLIPLTPDRPHTFHDHSASHRADKPHIMSPSPSSPSVNTHQSLKGSVMTSRTSWMLSSITPWVKKI